jgi:hypothetical protein
MMKKVANFIGRGRICSKTVFLEDADSGFIREWWMLRLMLDLTPESWIEGSREHCRNKDYERQ